MDPRSEAVRKHLRVTGRVQGVGFRWFTRSLARELGVVGWVKNEADGSVSCEAQARGSVMEEFVAGVRRGPRFSRVDGVQVENREPEGDAAGFEVLH